MSPSPHACKNRTPRSESKATTTMVQSYARRLAQVDPRTGPACFRVRGHGAPWCGAHECTSQLPLRQMVASWTWRYESDALAQPDLKSPRLGLEPLGHNASHCCRTADHARAIPTTMLRCHWSKSPATEPRGWALFFMRATRCTWWLSQPDPQRRCWSEAMASVNKEPH